MAFVRIKKIKGKEYAYLVKNVWKDGKVKQKTLKYLGKINDFKTNKINDFEEANAINSVITNVLLDAGFNQKLELNGLKVNINKQKVTFSGKESAIRLNEGILSSNSLKKLLNYEAQEELKPGLKLAKILSETGIEIEQEAFIKLYKVLHVS